VNGHPQFEPERLPAHHETYHYWAMIIVMTRRLARQPDIAQLTAT
jgi:hypothetical protein